MLCGRAAPVSLEGRSFSIGRRNSFPGVRNKGCEIMRICNHRLAIQSLAWLIAVALFTTSISVFGQTHIVPPKNKYSPNDDVKLGLEAARQAERQLPILHDADVTDYVASVGRRLAESIPPEYQHPEFHYTFKVVNASDINAFALPGGPMYVNRGMIEAAHNEGQMAGVMAHEMSHVALRHGTAQATKAQKYQTGAIAGAILGAVIGGPVGSVVGETTQLGVGAAFLRFSREYEKQADILGAQIMARAGYDPHDLAEMFKLIEQQGGSRGPQWLSDHPNPGNRYAYINEEASHLQVSPNPIKVTAEFRSIKERLSGFPRARSTAQISQAGGRRYPDDDRDSNGRRDPSDDNGSSSRRRRPDDDPGDSRDSRSNARLGRPEPPSSDYRTYNEGGLFSVSVPVNWQELRNNDLVTFAPRGGFGRYNGSDAVTHGVQMGLVHSDARSLRDATDQFISSLTSSNKDLHKQGGYSNSRVDGLYAIETSLSNLEPATGRPETVVVYTTLTRAGNLFYAITVAPREEYPNYESTFQSVLRSVRISQQQS
jgi:hypothetical protein